ncbi:hypothetical protein MFRU_010g02030 [Monilinia fructicola]|nr:hypothetical protein MFRU_010g02030 [Monilinia fructicola]
MTRPEIIRADSIDLQDQNSPSAQDHSKKNANAAPLGAGPPAPHQAEALREVAAEAADEQHRSPRVSREWTNGEGQMIQDYTNDDLAARVASALNGNNQQDDLAIAQNGGLTASGGEDGDMADAEGDDGMDDDMMDKISSSPSIDDEDIDFEFVYALHTFVATVEGQANATKGDTMVLLDDSNSYWWLVRVVKDSSIGYLPAEHIETPTERLARLNKHRNIEYTSSQLLDHAEKSKNPLKKAIRRRNTKTVTFAAPTYVEASDVDYSTDEDDGDGDFYGQHDQSEHQEHNVDDDEIVAIEPLKPRSELREVQSESPERDNSTSKSSLDTGRSSDEMFEGKLEGSKSRNGTLRNTDSFFKDDTVETRKITLTPNLLRDDSSSSTRTSNDSEKLKQRPSLDKIEKDLVSDKTKERKEKKDKKDKEKKPGMLSGLFKRKDKKSKHQDDDLEDSITSSKQSSENPRSSPSPSKDSDLASVEESSPEAPKQPSKLQKQPPETSPIRKQNIREPRALEPQLATISERTTTADSPPGPSLRIVQPEPQMAASNQQENGNSPIVSSPKSPGPISKILHSAISSSSEPKPVKAKKAKSRVELDDFDSSSEDSEVEEPIRSPVQQTQRPIPGSFPESYVSTPATENRPATGERLSESPVEVSPITPTNSHPPALMVDTSSQEEAPSPVSSPSPELIDADDIKKGTGSSIASTSTPTWNDSQLRTFFDDDTDIRDLLVVVYDKSGVVPAGSDHPVVGNLFKEENAKLADITNRLDGMLGDWLARKMRTQSSR